MDNIYLENTQRKHKLDEKPCPDKFPVNRFLIIAKEVRDKEKENEPEHSSADNFNIYPAGINRLAFC